jgi:hypothetical protein
VFVAGENQMLARKKRLLSAGLILFFLIIAIDEVHALQIPDVVTQLTNKAKHFYKLRTDFVDFAKSFLDTNSNEAELCTSFGSSAYKYQEIADTTAMVLFMYSLITEEKNKEIAALTIMPLLKRYVTSLEGEIQFINGYLALTKTPAVASNGNRLRDETRELIRILNSIKLP